MHKAPLWQKAFIAALANGNSITAAAQAAGINRGTAYSRRKTHPKFAQAMDDASEQSADLLEDEARRRAFEGSDVLLIFLLKGMRPEKFRESRSTVPPAQLNEMVEAELKRLQEAKNEAEETSEAVN